MERKRKGLICGKDILDADKTAKVRIKEKKNECLSTGVKVRGW